MLKLPCLTYFSNSFLNLFGVCLSVHKPSWLSKHVCVCLFVKLFFFFSALQMFSEKSWLFSWFLFSPHLDFLVGYCSRLTPHLSMFLNFLCFPLIIQIILQDYSTKSIATQHDHLLFSPTRGTNLSFEISYENLWFVYLSLRALGVPRLELCCWKSPHELEDRNIQKLLIADLNICSFKC